MQQQQTVSGFLRKDVVIALKHALTRASTADNACLLAAELACSAATGGEPSAGTFDATGVVSLLLDEYARWHAGANLTLVARIAAAASAATAAAGSLGTASAALCELVLLVMVDVLAARDVECSPRDQMRRMADMAKKPASLPVLVDPAAEQTSGTDWPAEALAWRAHLHRAIAGRRATQAIAVAVHAMSRDRGKLCTWLPHDATAVPVPESVADMVTQRSHRLDPLWYAWSTVVSLAETTDPNEALEDVSADERRAFVEHSLRIYATCFRSNCRSIRLPLVWYAFRVMGRGAAPHVPASLGVPVLDDPALMRQAACDFTQAVVEKLALQPSKVPVVTHDPEVVPLPFTPVVPLPFTPVVPLQSAYAKSDKKCVARAVKVGRDYLQMIVRVDPASTAERLVERDRVYAAECESIKTAGVRSVVSRMA